MSLDFKTFNIQLLNARISAKSATYLLKTREMQAFPPKITLKLLLIEM